MNEGHEHHVEFLESGEDAPKALEPSKQALDLIAPLVHLAVVLPRRDSIRLRWHHGNEAQVQGELSGFLALVGTVHLGAPSRRSNCRPSGASCACPGDSANVIAVRAFAATI